MFNNKFDILGENINDCLGNVISKNSAQLLLAGKIKGFNFLDNNKSKYKNIFDYLEKKINIEFDSEPIEFKKLINNKDFKDAYLIYRKHFEHLPGMFITLINICSGKKDRFEEDSLILLDTLKGKIKGLLLEFYCENKYKKKGGIPVFGEQGNNNKVSNAIIVLDLKQMDFLKLLEKDQKEKLSLLQKDKEDKKSKDKEDKKSDELYIQLENTYTFEDKLNFTTEEGKLKLKESIKRIIKDEYFKIEKEQPRKEKKIKEHSVLFGGKWGPTSKKGLGDISNLMINKIYNNVKKSTVCKLNILNKEVLINFLFVKRKNKSVDSFLELKKMSKDGKYLYESNYNATDFKYVWGKKLTKKKLTKKKLTKKNLRNNMNVILEKIYFEIVKQEKISNKDAQSIKHRFSQSF